MVGIVVLILIGIFFILSTREKVVEQVTLNYWGLWELVLPSQIKKGFALKIIAMANIIALIIFSF